MRVRGTAFTGHPTVDCESFTDDEYREITWSICAPPDTNEIAVSVAARNVKITVAQELPHALSAMVDRVISSREGAQNLAHSLIENIWNAHSERLIEEALTVRKAAVCELIRSKAAELFGSEYAAAEWLRSGVQALDFKKPKDLMRSGIGRQRVWELLGRIEHGVFT